MFCTIIFLTKIVHQDNLTTNLIDERELSHGLTTSESNKRQRYPTDG
jgi:hypothetical protein